MERAWKELGEVEVERGNQEEIDGRVLTCAYKSAETH